MIDKRFIGHAMPAFEVDVENGRLRFFAKAVGLSDPVYVDEAAAQAAGHASLLVPPTFFFCLEMESGNVAEIRTLLNLSYKNLLHGEQAFTYHRLAYGGDRLRFEQRIADIYDKKGGELEFVVRSTIVTNQHQQLVAELKNVIVQRNPK
jgi:acyl dehydratase